MPPAAVWLPAAIGAAAAVGSGVVASRAQSGAAKRQLAANQEALNYEREREAKAQRQKAAQDAAYRKAWNEWAARVGDEGIQRYGVPIGLSYPGAKPGATPAAKPAAVRMEPAPSGPVVPAAGMASSGGRIGDLIQQQGDIQANSAASSGQIWGNALGGVGQQAAPLGQSMMANQNAQTAGASVPATTMEGVGAGAGSIGSLSGWNDWNPYLSQGD
jgi:hypothetical protein